jgi:hypothetical protein
MQVTPHWWSALRTFAPLIGQLGEPFPVSGHFQPERLVILPMRIGRHFASLFGMPAVFLWCGHHTIVPAVIRIHTQKRSSRDAKALPSIRTGRS